MTAHGLDRPGPGVEETGYYLLERPARQARTFIANHLTTADAS